MYKRILVPTDGSATSKAGLREAVNLAKEQGAHLRIVHVIDELPVASAQLYGTVMDQFVAQAREGGKLLAAEARAMAEEAGVPVDVKLIEALGGRTGEYVVQAATEWPADLIVCGTHGRRGLRRIVMGSDAEYIVRRSPVPILLVRAVEADT
jgi:nucleotide-binding universal stress UspA family protein